MLNDRKYGKTWIEYLRAVLFLQCSYTFFHHSSSACMGFHHNTTVMRLINRRLMVMVGTVPAYLHFTSATTVANFVGTSLIKSTDGVSRGVTVSEVKR